MSSDDCAKLIFMGKRIKGGQSPGHPGIIEETELCELKLQFTENRSQSRTLAFRLLPSDPNHVDQRAITHTTHITLSGTEQQ